MEKLSVRAQRPPMVRAATSMTVARPSLTRISAWTGPWTSPRVRQAEAVVAFTAVMSVAGSRDGVT